MATLVGAWDDLLSEAEELAYLTDVPARDPETEPLPEVHPNLRKALLERGVERIYRHQAESYAAASRGENLVVATGTASGKTLAFNLPVLDALAAEPKLRALYLYPTKALAQDQLRALGSFRLPKLRAAMHLDTVCTMVDVDAVLMYPNMAEEMRALAVTTDGEELHVAERPAARQDHAVVAHINQLIDVAAHLGLVVDRPHVHGQARPLDFDDASWGHYAMDLAITVDGVPEPLRPALLGGYRAVQPLPGGYEEHAAALLAGRRLFLATFLLANQLPAAAHLDLLRTSPQADSAEAHQPFWLDVAAFLPSRQTMHQAVSPMDASPARAGASPVRPVRERQQPCISCRARQAVGRPTTCRPSPGAASSPAPAAPRRGR